MQTQSFSSKKQTLVKKSSLYFYAFLFSAIGIIPTNCLHAQGALEKVKEGTAKTKDVLETGKDVKNTLNSLFGNRKKAKEAPKADTIVTKPAAPIVTKTIIVEIASIEYAKLKTFEDNFKGIAGVKNTSKKFNTSSSTIDVEFSGSPDELWDLLPIQVKDTFELKGINEGKIILEPKK